MARIETILERIEAKVDKLESDVAADVKDLAALKNKGTGLLIGVALAAGTLGASVVAAFDKLAAIFR